MPTDRAHVMTAMWEQNPLLGKQSVLLVLLASFLLPLHLHAVCAQRATIVLIPLWPPWCSVLLELIVPTEQVSVTLVRVADTPQLDLDHATFALLVTTALMPLSGT